jgi:2-haloacid dehalogenase
MMLELQPNPRLFPFRWFAFLLVLCVTLPRASHAQEERMKKPIERPQVLIFDVNESMLDLSGMASEINKSFHDESAFQRWFSLMLQYSLVDNVTGRYHNFGKIGDAAMRMTAQLLGKEISDDERRRLLKLILVAPPHPDVVEGLTQLKKAGYRMVTLTNSTQNVVTQQLEHAGLAKYFETSISIDDVQAYKPQLDAYKLALRRVNVKAGQAMLIAAHGWDVAGAAAAGLQTAFIARKGHVLYPLAPEPTIKGDTLIEIARQLTGATPGGR